MNITIKQLQGGECSLKVSPTTKILDIKKQIAIKLRIPIEEQKLLLLGRALTDNQTVASYPSIKNGTKLNLVVKKPDGLLEVAARCFKRNGMSEAEARTKANLLLKVVEEKCSKLSWDDIERLSLDCLLDECAQLHSAQGMDNDTVCDMHLVCDQTYTSGKS